jgi:hypothetical protein
MRSTPQDILNPDAYDRAMSSAPHDDPAEIRHPLLRRLLAMWEAKCGDRMMPTRANFDVLELKDWLGNLMLIKVLDGATEFSLPPLWQRARLLLWARSHRQADRGDATGNTRSRAP